jgi:predicted dehydrogenase
VLSGFQFRFHPGLRQVRDLLAAVGTLVEVEAHWGEYLPQWHPWEDYRRSYSSRAELGGGVVLTLCHPFDYLRWLVGEVAEVSATVSTCGDLEVDVEDTADIELRFANGVPGHVHLNYTEQPPSHWMRLSGSQGTISWNAADGMIRLAGGCGERVLFPAPDGFERNSMFLEEMRHFIACVEGREQPLCTLEDGIQALRIALAAKQSAREGWPIRISS